MNRSRKDRNLMIAMGVLVVFAAYNFLVRPQGAANLGAVARAMKNMGLRDLVLVESAVRRSFWTKAMAGHAGDVLQNLRPCASIAVAVADCGLVVGTTCRDGLYRAASEPPQRQRQEQA